MLVHASRLRPCTKDSAGNHSKLRSLRQELLVRGCIVQGAGPTEELTEC